MSRESRLMSAHEARALLRNEHPVTAKDEATRLSLVKADVEELLASFQEFISESPWQERYRVGTNSLIVAREVEKAMLARGYAAIIHVQDRGVLSSMYAVIVEF